jgi:hypothetical protein
VIWSRGVTLVVAGKQLHKCNPLPLAFKRYTTPWLLLIVFLLPALSGCGVSWVNAAAAEGLAVSPGTVSFGEVPVGQTAGRTVSFSNQGPKPIVITQISLKEPSFTLGGSSNLPATLAAGHTLNLDIRFNPATAGPATGQLTVVTDAVTEIGLSGAGAAVLTALGCVDSSLPPAGTVACTITLNTPAPAGGVTVALSSSDVAVIVPSSTTVPAGAVKASFQAMTHLVGTAHAATLTATDGAVSKSIALQLKAGVPTLSVSPNSILFGSVAVDTPAVRYVTLSSTGTAPVTVDSAALTGPGFAIVGGVFPVTLAPAQALTLGVRFNPGGAGAASGRLTIASNSSTTAESIALAGTGTAALSALVCGESSMLGSGTDACTITLNAPAPAGGLVVSLFSSSSAVGVPGSAMVPANGVVVGFTAAVQMVGTSQVATISATAGGISKTFPLQLNAGVPILSVSAGSVAFGDVTMNRPAMRSVSLLSTGTEAVTVTAVTVTGAGFAVVGAALPVTLSPNIAVTLNVQFDPNVPGAATGQLIIRSNSVQNNSALVVLSGTGLEASSAYWLAPPVGSVNSLGSVTMSVADKGKVQLLSPIITGDGGPLVCVATSWNSAGTSLTITYSMGAAAVHVILRITPTPGGLNAEMDADQAAIASVDMGSWAPNLRAQPIPVPYYTSDVWYAPNLSAFVNGWWDWHATQATWLNGTAARYLPKTDGTFNRLHEVLAVAESPDLDAVFPAPGNTASPYISLLSGRTVIDIWNEGFSDVEQGLSDLGDYGITNCVAIIHDWQYAGYDNALPEQYPANLALGGGAGLQAAIGQGRADGCLVAVHENYLDYFPNYPDFQNSAVALNSDGSQILGWLNPTTGVQSLATKSSLMVPNAQKQSPLIHASYGTTASYLDVNSAAQPSSYDDMEASSPQAGQQLAYFQNSQALWAYEREAHDGPVLGEGGDHWYYSGLLDGVEAQLGAGDISANSEASVPLFVDFDLLQIHPLQVNHGMGYYSRWTRSGTWTMTTAQMDAYRMQEIAFGHAPFLTTNTWNNVPSAFTESNLVSPVATSYGTAKATSIQNLVEGAWTSSSAAAISGDFMQVQVAYDNGLTVVANGSATPIAWKDLTIPQYGWAAESANVLAYTAQCGTTICDYAQTATSIFANSRNQSDAQMGWGYARPSVNGVKQGVGRSFTIFFDWLVYRTLGTQTNYSSFVHFVDDSQALNASAGIVFQGDYQPNPATSLWQVGQTISVDPVTVEIPSSVPDGTYSIRVGLDDPASGKRLLLSGDNDGTERYIVGNLTISGGGAQVQFTAPPPSPSDPRLNASGSLVNFGTVQTDGMVSIVQEGGQWVLRPFPRNRNFQVLLNKAEFPIPAAIQTVGSSSSTITPADQGAWWRLPLTSQKSYSWPIK